MPCCVQQQREAVVPCLRSPPSTAPPSFAYLHPIRLHSYLSLLLRHQQCSPQTMLHPRNLLPLIPPPLALLQNLKLDLKLPTYCWHLLLSAPHTLPPYLPLPISRCHPTRLPSLQPWQRSCCCCRCCQHPFHLPRPCQRTASALYSRHFLPPTLLPRLLHLPPPPAPLRAAQSPRPHCRHTVAASALCALRLRTPSPPPPAGPWQPSSAQRPRRVHLLSQPPEGSLLLGARCCSPRPCARCCSAAAAGQTVCLVGGAVGVRGDMWWMGGCVWSGLPEAQTSLPLEMCCSTVAALQTTL
jgi:hypothetical protein